MYGKGLNKSRLQASRHFGSLTLTSLIPKAIALQRQKKHEDAMKFLKELLQIDPGHAPALLNAGECSQVCAISIMTQWFISDNRY